MLTSFSARISALSFVRLNSDECCNFLVWLIIAFTSSFLEWPHTLHHMLATPSSNLFPLESISHIPSPFVITSNVFHSLICVYGCQTKPLEFNQCNVLVLALIMVR